VSAPTTPGPDFPAGPGRLPYIEAMSEQQLETALREGARDRGERAAVHLALATGVLTRSDFRNGYLYRVGDREVRVEWRILHAHLPEIPLSSEEEAALRVACSLALPGLPVDLATCLSRMDANLRLAASGAFRRMLLGSGHSPELS
jgi:hypothetical protein